MKRWILLFIFSGVFLLPLFTQSANSSFSLKPAKKDLSLKPSETREEFLTVTNNLGQSATLSIFLEDLDWEKDSSLRLGVSGNSVSLKDLTQVSTSQLRLENGESLKIPIKISLPEGMAPGTYPLLIRVNAEGKEGATKVNSSLASLWLVRVEGQVKEEGLLKSFKVSGFPLIFYRQPLEAYISYENRGNVHLNPHGLVEVRNLFGQKVAAFFVAPWLVLPQSERTHEIELNSHKWLGGIYKTTLYLNRGYGDMIDESNLYFYYLPWQLILVLGGIIVIWLVLKFKLWKRFHN